MRPDCQGLIGACVLLLATVTAGAQTISGQMNGAPTTPTPSQGQTTQGLAQGQAPGANPAAGQTLAARGGANGVAACIACHGAGGQGQAGSGFPMLAGLDQAYLAKQIYDFKSGRRANPLMTPIARAMNDEQIRNVSAYYAGMPLAINQSRPPDPKLVQAGAELALHGAWDRGMPACAQCHGNHGQGAGAHFPALRGQHADYIANQLKAWQSGQRKNDPNGLMAGVARKLSAQDTEAVAAYYSYLGQNQPLSNAGGRR